MILNLTNSELNEGGIANLPEQKQAELNQLLHFDAILNKSEIEERADAIATIAITSFLETEEKEGKRGLMRRAMIDGAPFLLAQLELSLLKSGIFPVYALYKNKERVGFIQKYGIPS